MKPNACFLFFLVNTCLSCIHLASSRRIRHFLSPVYEDKPYIPPQLWPTHLYTPGSYPFMHQESHERIQPLPFQSEFMNGWATGSSNIRILRGNLNIPSVRHRAIWDLNGQLRTGPTLTHYNWRNSLGPLNALKLSPAAQNVMHNDPAFKRDIGDLGWSVPGGCTSIYCATREPNFDAAMVYQPPQNFYINGKLDFPIFNGPYGEGHRFDRHFDLFAGRHPIAVTIGEHTNPFIMAMRQQRLLMEQQERAMELLDGAKST